MDTSRITHLAAATLLALGGLGCGVIGPTCLGRQQRGTVATFEGEVAAGQMTLHRARYATEGSQNDAHLSWGDDSIPTGPRLRFYATGTACTDFQPPPAVNTGACAVLASAGCTEIGIARTLILTHGRGNPERLGSPPAYTIWVVGDAERSVRYSIAITWFFGPDC